MIFFYQQCVLLTWFDSICGRHDPRANVPLWQLLRAWANATLSELRCCVGQRTCLVLTYHDAKNLTSVVKNNPMADTWTQEADKICTFHSDNDSMVQEMYKKTFWLYSCWSSIETPGCIGSLNLRKSAFLRGSKQQSYQNHHLCHHHNHAITITYIRLYCLLVIHFQLSSSA